MEEHFRISRKFGFKFLEFGIGGGQPGRLPEEPTETDVAEFRALGERYGINTPFCCIENDFTFACGAEHDAMVAKVLAQVRSASACGATHVRLFAGFTPAAAMTEEIWGRVFAAFESCESLCSGLGIQIAIETHGALEFQEDGSAVHINSITTDRECLARLLEHLPSGVGFNYDPGNIRAVSPGDERYCLDLLNDRINYCHLKDWHPRGEGWVACAIGDDALDYGPLFEKMKFEGVYLIEYEPLEDSEDGIQRSLDYLGTVAPGFTLDR
ncbi:MAG: sugar phosphate isomerase/epimerase [Planctomycetota bacterium]|nr:sugar phosphate isomerase/epimerase [Planctomycetota bacterium]